MDEIAMRAVDLDNVEAGRQRALRRRDEGRDQILNLAFGECAGRRIAFALWNGTGRDAGPGSFRPVLTLDRCGAVPGAFGAGATPGMADLDPACGTVRVIEIDNPAQARHLFVVPDAGAAMGDAALARDAGRLDEAQSDAAGGEACVMLVMPVLDHAVDRRILAHRRQHDAIAQGEAAQGQRREQGGKNRHMGADPDYSAAWRALPSRLPSMLSISASISFITAFSFLTRASPSLPSSLKVVSGARTS